jgi:signal transduction histidine kinase
LPAPEYESTISEKSLGTLQRGIEGVDQRRHDGHGSPLALAFMCTVVVSVLLGLGFAAFSEPGSFLRLELLFWAVVLAAVELLPVPVSRVLQLSLGFPILLGIAILYTPLVAAAVAFIGSFDSREIRREITPLKSLFNRSQIAVSTLAGSVVFHTLGSVESPLQILIPAALGAATADYCANVTLVTITMRLLYRMSPRDVLHQLRLGALSEFLLNYMGLAFIGVIIAALFERLSFWAVAAFILPLVFARQMFFRNIALEEASKELKDREQVLRALSNRMAEERQDERMQIAAYLHDDLAQMLFRLTLQAEMAKKRLAQGEVAAVERDLDGIMRTKQETSDAIRALIRDLHRSPIGRKGLAEAIQSFAEDMSRGHPTAIATEVIEVSLPPPIQLLIYQIAREATMNALKHAEAAHIGISLEETEDGVRLQIRDDGKGFDTTAPPPEGHFGSVMMRERALVAGGTFSVESEVGQGTTIAASFPRVWVEEGSQLEAAAATAKGAPGTQRPPVGSTTGPVPGPDQRVAATTGLPATRPSLQPGEDAPERTLLAAEPVGSGGTESPEEADEPAAMSGLPEDGKRAKQSRPDRRAIPA